MTTDPFAPPTDEEIDAVHEMMLGTLMVGERPWRRAVRTIIEEFQRMRSQPKHFLPREEAPASEGWLSPEMAAAARRMGME